MRIRRPRRDRRTTAVRVAVLRRDDLPVDVRRNAAHLVMDRRHDRNRLLDRIDVRELDRDLADRRQPLDDHLGAEVIELQQHVVLVRTAAAPFLDLLVHRARDDVARREVLQVRRIALHEALAVRVEQDPAFAAHAFGDQHAGARDAGRMELPELHVLERNAGARGHAEAVAGVDERVGGRGEDAARAAGGEQRRPWPAASSLRRFPSRARSRRARRRRHRGSGRAPSTRRRTACARARCAGRACAASRGRCGRRRRTRAAPASRRSSPSGRRTAAGRSCRPGCGRTACRNARARRRPSAPSRHMYSIASWSPSQSEPLIGVVHVPEPVVLAPCCRATRRCRPARRRCASASETPSTAPRPKDRLRRAAATRAFRRRRRRRSLHRSDAWRSFIGACRTSANAQASCASPQHLDRPAGIGDQHAHDDDLQRQAGARRLQIVHADVPHAHPRV